MSSYGVPGELFTMLAQAKAQPDSWYKDLSAANSSAGSIADTVKSFQDTTRQKKLDTFFDTSVPVDTLKRVLPGAPTDGSITYRDLGGLSGSGLTSILKTPDNTADPMTLSILGGQGDPDKTSKLFQMFTQNKDASGSPVPLKINAATLGAIKAMRPPTPRAAGGSASPEVNTLKALQSTYTKQLSGDISESERQTAQANLTAVNNRLARMGGVTLQAPAAPKPIAPIAAPSAPAPAAGSGQTTSQVIQQLLTALSK